MPRSSTAAGLGLVTLSAASFGTSGPFADSLLATGWSPLGAVTLRVGLGALVLTLPGLLALQGKWRSLTSQKLFLGLYGLIAVAGAQLFFFNAVEHLSVGVALLLEYSGILLVVLWMWVVHHHRPRRLTVLGAALSLSGLVVVLDVLNGAHVDGVGVLWGLAGAVALAVYYVLSSSDHSDVPPLATAWVGLVIGTLVLLLAGLVHLQPFTTSTQQVRLADASMSWVIPVLCLGFVAAATAYVAGIAGARLLGPKVSSFVGLSEMLFAIVFAALLVDQRLTTSQGIGGALVVAGIALVRADEASVS